MKDATDLELGNDMDLEKLLTQHTSRNGTIDFAIEKDDKTENTRISS